MPTTLSVEFGPKFCQLQLDAFLGKVSISAPYTDEQFANSYWSISILPDVGEVIFNLTLTEWIATEEVVFLFAWIKTLLALRKKITVHLPYAHKLETLYSKAQLQVIQEKYNLTDNFTRIRKRKNRNIFLMFNWGMLHGIGLTIDRFENVLGSSHYSQRSNELLANDTFNKVIPFTAIDASFDGDLLKYDQYFKQVLNDKSSSSKNNIFYIEKRIREILRTNACYTPFESRILSNVIFREIYLNACQHSFRQPKILKEVYMATSFSARHINAATLRFTDLLAERDRETLDFFKDKQKVLSNIQSQLPNYTSSSTAERRARLDNFADLKNCSYVEYTIMDFGIGIRETINEQYEQKKGELSKWLSNGHEQAHLDAKMIEFACLLETSSIPLDRNVDQYELVPRGLYFMVDMVRRFKGLIKIRSGRGMVVYDFSDQVYLKFVDKKLHAETRPSHAIKDCVIHSDAHHTAYFPGLLISVILPEKQELKVNGPLQTEQPVRLEQRNLEKYVYYLDGAKSIVGFDFKTLAPKSYEYISLLFLFNEVTEEYIRENNLISETSPSQDVRQRNHIFYNRVYSGVSKKLDEYYGKNCVIFFDFKGFHYDTQVLKIIYYLLETPKINENTKAIIVNTDAEHTAILQVLKERINFEIQLPALYKPIPCITFNQSGNPSAFWIGLQDTKDENLLNDVLLKGSVANVNQFAGGTGVSGNLLYTYNEYVYSFIVDEDDNPPNIHKEFGEARKKGISNFVKRYIIDGTKVDKEGKQSIFLATNGTWQKKYLSLYEVLHDKYIAAYFASALLDDYLQKTYDKIRSIREIILDPEEAERQAGLVAEAARFDKIVTVTVSSQLIGVAIRELIREDNRYEILKKKHANALQAAPSLLILSSYHSFEEERPFKKINPLDKLIIVNDVMGTGRLIAKLIDKLSNAKAAEVKGVMCIVDTRIKNEDLKDEQEGKSVFYPEFEKDKLFELVNYLDDIVIRKYLRPHPVRPDDITVKRINPLLNSIVELRAVHSEEEKILFRDPAELINTNGFNEEVFRVGHFNHNLIHNGYMTDMSRIFSNDSSESGQKLLEKLSQKMAMFKTAENQVESLIRNIVLDLQTLKGVSSEIVSEVDNITGMLKDITLKVPNQDTHTLMYPDFIFYPIFSGIEQLSHNTISTVFKTPVENIIGLQRFETAKGWRFPFPPKRFNQLTKNKKVLILDSGSLTGESLVQLIDNVTFLDVRSITVVSVICRIEDFYREIYSKLKYIKVKVLRGDAAPANLQQSAVEHVVPLRILFGINLHIPVYPGPVTCPFCKELENLQYYREQINYYAASEWTINYLNDQQENLRITNLGLEDKYSIPDYLPQKNAKLETIDLFLMRDRLGKIESFRFYPEYFQYFDKLIAELDEEDFYGQEKTKKLEIILALILHEPRILETIRDLLVDVLDACERILNDIVIKQEVDSLNLYYDWPVHGLIQLTFIFFKGKMYKKDNFQRLFAFANGNIKGYNYLSFLLWKGFFKIDKNAAVCEDAKNVVLEMAKQIAIPLEEAKTVLPKADRIYENVVVKDIIREITDHLKNIATLDVNQAYFNLYKFFIVKSSSPTHDELSKSISRIIVEIQDEALSNQEVNQIFQKTSAVIETIKIHIFDNLTVIKSAYELRKLQESTYYTLFDLDTSIYKTFENLYHAFISLRQLFGKVVDKKEAENVLAEIIARVEDFQFQHLLTRSFLFQYALQYRCNLVSCIKAAERETLELVNKRNNFKVVINAESDCFVNAHADLLYVACRELIVNASKVEDNDDSQMQWLVQKTDAGILLKVVQQAYFKNHSGHKGGYYKEVEPIFRLFGKENSFRMETNPFEIEVVFNQNTLL